jgi:hypothetical protein
MRGLMNRLEWGVLGVLVVVAVGTAGISWWLDGNNPDGFDYEAWWSNLLQNIGAGVIALIVAYILFEIVVGGQKEKAEEIERTRRELEATAAQDEKEIKRLIIELGSLDNPTTSMAARELRERGCLTDGTLRKAKLISADLHGDGSVGASGLYNADLQEANLAAANLQAANLYGANLKYTVLILVNLQRADLRRANLEGAILDMARLANAMFNEETILPDGDPWSKNVDMRKFTNPEHPDYERWRVLAGFR